MLGCPQDQPIRPGRVEFYTFRQKLKDGGEEEYFRLREVTGNGSGSSNPLNRASPNGSRHSTPRGSERNGRSASQRPRSNSPFGNLSPVGRTPTPPLSVTNPVTPRKRTPRSKTPGVPVRSSSRIRNRTGLSPGLGDLTLLSPEKRQASQEFTNTAKRTKSGDTNRPVPGRDGHNFVKTNYWKNDQVTRQTDGAYSTWEEDLKGGASPVHKSTWLGYEETRTRRGNQKERDDKRRGGGKAPEFWDSKW